MPNIAVMRLTLSSAPNAVETRAFYTADPDIQTVLGAAMLERLAALTPGVTASYTVEVFDLDNPPA